jgi:hypothetical protein
MANLTITPKYVRPLAGAYVSTKRAGEALSVGNLVYVAGDGDLNLCDADTAATMTAQLGLVVAGANASGLTSPTGAIANEEYCTVLWFGRVALDPASLDETKQYYVSNTAGKIADGAGTNTRRVGAPESDTIFFFNPNTVAINY